MLRDGFSSFAHGVQASHPVQFPWVSRLAHMVAAAESAAKAAQEVGINVFDHHLEENTNQDELINLINQLNNNKDVNGILIQLPLPKTINEEVGEEKKQQHD